VTIAGSRLEIAMGQLWWQLDKDNVSEERTRKLGVDQQARAIRQRARTQSLWGDLQSAVLEAVETAQNRANRRNDIVHQDWVLRGPDAMRPVADLPEPTSSSERELFKYVDEWRRSPKTPGTGFGNRARVWSWFERRPSPNSSGLSERWQPQRIA